MIQIILPSRCINSREANQAFNLVGMIIKSKEEAIIALTILTIHPGKIRKDGIGEEMIEIIMRKIMIEGKEINKI